MSDALALEKKLAEISSGARVTLEDINNAIISEHYFTAKQGVMGSQAPWSGYLDSSPLGRLTFCVLVLWNGFTVTGQSACVDPANYNKEIGENIARQNAVNQIWPLMGFDLASRKARDQRLLGGVLVECSPHMLTYIGTKVVNAQPMKRHRYCEMRGWQVPADENGADDGYLVEYTDKLEGNVPDYQGYVSWSPKDVFERAYQQVSRG